MLLRNDQQKLLREWEVFISFCRSSGLDVEDDDVVMLDPSSSNPPPPDVKCQIQDQDYFFELCEIIQEDIAQASSLRNTRRIVSPREPLARIWSSLSKALTKKIEKTYSLEARPRFLLLYYDRSPSFWKFLRPVVEEKGPEIRTILKDASTFDRIFIFDVGKAELLLDLSADPLCKAD